MSFPSISFSIPTIAVAKSRAKRGSHGQAYIPQKTRSFEAEIKWHWQLLKLPMLPKVPTRLVILCLLPKPVKAKKTDWIPVTRPDLDNYAKAIMDSLNGFAWKDDGQISDLEIKKRYTTESPRVIIEIYPAEVTWGLNEFLSKR